MLLAACLVPDTVLLLPGAAGRAPDDAALVALRAAAHDGVTRAVTGAARVVVVGPGPADRTVSGLVRAGAAAVGVPDHLLVQDVPVVRLTPAPAAPAVAPGPPGPGTVAGLRLALDAGVPAERLHVVEVAPATSARLRATGAALVTGAPTVLVVVGSGSARHGHDAPQPHDARADGLDRRLIAALRAGGAPARDALADLDPQEAAALAVSGWAPWQVLVGALDATAPWEVLPGPDVLRSDVWHGAAHAAVLWAVTA